MTEQTLYVIISALGVLILSLFFYIYKLWTRLGSNGVLPIIGSPTNPGDTGGDETVPGLTYGQGDFELGSGLQTNMISGSAAVANYHCHAVVSIHFKGNTTPKTYLLHKYTVGQMGRIERHKILAANETLDLSDAESVFVAVIAVRNSDKEPSCYAKSYKVVPRVIPP